MNWADFFQVIRMEMCDSFIMPKIFYNEALFPEKKFLNNVGEYDENISYQK